jgi:CheY-like chemotaxis protein
MGYPVIEAAHAEEALDLLQTVPDIGLLISDIVMPGRLDGRALSRQARLRHPDMRILLISGYADAMNLPPEDGGPPLLRKPFSSSELGDALEQLDTP